MIRDLGQLHYFGSRLNAALLTDISKASTTVQLLNTNSQPSIVTPSISEPGTTRVTSETRKNVFVIGLKLSETFQRVQLAV